MASWMHRASKAWRIVAVASVVSLTTGCELLVDFDRSLIDGGSDDSGTDATGPMTDAGDASVPDSSPTDAAPVDSGLDATTVDASQDGGEDASPQDAGPDAQPDAQADAAPDGGDAGEDAAVDAGEDAATDAGEDAAVDAAADAAVDAATDAGEDAATDAGNDAGQDAGTLASGMACSGNTQCASGVCGIAGSGNCCAAACAAVGAPCGATACDGAGACMFPSTSVVCATSCSGNTLTTLSCTGAGACASTGGVSASCSNNLACASGTACATACGSNNAAGDANCATGDFCDGVGTGACQSPLAAGGTCNRTSQCTSSVCTGGVCQPTCTDGAKDGSETDTDCGGSCSPCANTKSCSIDGDCQSENCPSGSCVEATVLVVGAGAASSFGSELHPSTLGNGTWSTPTSLGAPSVSDLGLAFVSNGATPAAVGALRYTLMSDPLDQYLVYSTWSETSGFTQFAMVANLVTTREVPAIAGAGGSAFVSFQGTDFNLYFAEFDGSAWSPTNEPVGVGNTPTPAGIAALGSNASIAYFSSTNEPTVQDRTTTWQAATTLGTDSSFVATPSIVAMNGGTAELLTVYIRKSDGALVYNTRTGGAWSTPSSTIPGATAPQSSTYGPVERVGLAALPSGGAIATWRDATTSGIFYSLYAAGAWSAAPIAFASPNAVVSSAPSVTHGVAGATAEMAFVAGDANAYHSRLVAGTWSSPVQAISGGATDHVAIAAAP